MELEIENIVDIQYLMDIVENHKDVNTRVVALTKLSQVINSSPESFQFFESLVVSDDDNNIKALAIRIIANKFLKLGEFLLEWLIKNDKSVYVNYSILKVFKQKNFDHYRKLKEIILHRYTSIYGLVNEEVKFFMDLEFLCCKYNHNCEVGCFSRGGYAFEDIYAFNRSVYEHNFFKINGRVRLLDLQGLSLKELPSSIGKLTKLRKLRLRNNNLVSLPKEIENL